MGTGASGSKHRSADLFNSRNLARHRIPSVSLLVAPSNLTRATDPIKPAGFAFILKIFQLPFLRIYSTFLW